MKLAVRESMARGATLPEKLSYLERLGVEGVELEVSAGLPQEDLRTAFAASPVAAANVPGSTRLLDPDPAERTAALELTAERLRVAGGLGAVGVLVVPQFGTAPLLPDLAPFRSAVDLERELLVLQLRELAPVARDAGTVVFLEPLNRYEQHLVNRLEQGVKLARQAGPEVRIMADFFHMNIEEAEIAASLREAGDQVVYVHVADSNRLQPGRGHLDFRPGFRALKEAGYDGWLGIECRVTEPFEASLAESMTYLRREWEAA